MIKSVEARKEIKYMEFWTLRGIKDTGSNKKCVKECSVPTEPTEQDIVQFLIDGNDTFNFVSIEHNYALMPTEVC